MDFPPKIKMQKQEPETPHLSFVADSEGTPLFTDFISQLPDHILVHILSLLTMKEAGRTSILSKRWLFLWTHYPNLIFDVSKTLSSLMYDGRMTLEEEASALAAARHDYLNWVNQVVRSHRGPAIDQFMVQFGLDQSYSNHIDEWVQFAFQRNVQRLTLDLYDFTQSIHRCYCFPNITSSDSVLHQNMHRISRSLTSLRLVEVDVTGEVLQWFLSTCLFLESVAVHYSATLLNLEAHTTSLKSLEFKSCSELASVVLNAPNLESFACDGHMGNMILQLSSSHKLTKMMLGGYFCHYVLQNPLEYYTYLSEIVALELDVWAFEEVVLNSQFPLLARLERLEVKVETGDASLLGFAPLLKACPLLSEVTFKIYGCEFVEPEESEDGEQSDDVAYNSIRVVNLVGFVGDVIDVEFALYLMRNAPKLEKMSFDTRVPYLIGTVFEFQETEEREAARKRAERLVTRKLPLGVASVII